LSHYIAKNFALKLYLIKNIKNFKEVMVEFKDREKAFENKFAHDENIKFKIASRRRKLLGLWAGERFGLDDEKALEYAMEIVRFGLEDKQPGAVVKKIITDAEKNGVSLSEDEVRENMEEFEKLATKQIKEQ
jgi:hypothetical protein